MNFRYWGHGDISEHCFARHRMSEYGLLYAGNIGKKLPDQAGPAIHLAQIVGIVGPLLAIVAILLRCL